MAQLDSVEVLSVKLEAEGDMLLVPYSRKKNC